MRLHNHNFLLSSKVGDQLVYVDVALWRSVLEFDQIPWSVLPKHVADSDHVWNQDLQCPHNKGNKTLKRGVFIIWESCFPEIQTYIILATIIYIPYIQHCTDCNLFLQWQTDNAQEWKSYSKLPYFNNKIIYSTWSISCFLTFGNNTQVWYNKTIFTMQLL